MCSQILSKRIVPFVLAALLGYLAGSAFIPGESRDQSPSETDRGFGSGYGAGSTRDIPMLRKAGNVTILGKPRALYTDQARENSVQGVVTLRVSLLKDGTVGSVTVLNGLPDGLTQQAVDGAKKIKFIPATVDGVPVSKVVTVEYGFNIY